MARPKKPAIGSPEWAGKEARTLEQRLRQVRKLMLAASSPRDMAPLARLELALLRALLRLGERAPAASAPGRWELPDGGWSGSKSE